MLQIALAGDVDGQVLRAAGWRVRASLARTPYDDRADVAGYADLTELLEDEGLDAVALDGTDPLLARLLPDLLRAGLHVLVASPVFDVPLLQECRAVDSRSEVAVAFVDRWEPWATTAAAALQLVGTPVLQATVRGWPRGAVAAAELVDLARSWCGDVLAVLAAPAPLPAAVLGPGLPVAWALLHTGGATTLVSHEGAPPLVRLSFATARLEVGPLGARWEGGAEIPLPTVSTGLPPGLVAAAAGLRELVERGEPLPGEWPQNWPWPADLADLLATARVLEALRESARLEVPARVA